MANNSQNGNGANSGLYALSCGTRRATTLAGLIDVRTGSGYQMWKLRGTVTFGVKDTAQVGPRNPGWAASVPVRMLGRRCNML